MKAEEVRLILQKHFHRADGGITKPVDGQQKQCYIAQSEERRVFIKFDVPIPTSQRLGEIGAAPRVITSGIANGRSYIIQEYIAGSYPDRRWLAAHLPLLATFIRRYHDDQPTP